MTSSPVHLSLETLTQKQIKFHRHNVQLLTSDTHVSVLGSQTSKQNTISKFKLYLWTLVMYSNSYDGTVNRTNTKQRAFFELLINPLDWFNSFSTEYNSDTHYMTIT